MDDPEWADAVREQIHVLVRGGFAPVGGIVERVVEYLDEDATAEQIAQVAERILTEELEELSREQATWPRPTDNERLDAAFAALEAAGVVARQDFWCCQSCGHAAMPDEVRAAGARGYAFYTSRTPRPRSTEAACTSPTGRPRRAERPRSANGSGAPSRPRGCGSSGTGARAGGSGCRWSGGARRG